MMFVFITVLFARREDSSGESDDSCFYHRAVEQIGVPSAWDLGITNSCRPDQLSALLRADSESSIAHARTDHRQFTNKAEAKAILVEQLSRYKALSYADLKRLLKKQDIVEFATPSGSKYQMVFQAFWDDKSDGDLRVLGTIDDGGIRALSPLCEDFIMTPEGKFIDE